jgi:hypothetical protein
MKVVLDRGDGSAIAGIIVMIVPTSIDKMKIETRRLVLQHLTN